MVDTTHSADNVNPRPLHLIDTQDVSVDQKRCETADEFLEELRGSHQRWGDGWQTEWVFRGQADATWGLYPSAMRDRTPFAIRCAQHQFREFVAEGAPTAMPGGIECDPARFEEMLLHRVGRYAVVRQFARMARDSGLATPDADEFIARRSLDLHLPDQLEYVCGPTVIELMALAQHHGVPTQLLDWTRHAWSAAFFAAESCFRSVICGVCPRQPQSIAVWALNHLRMDSTVPIKCVEPNMANNLYLKAQSGLMTFDSHAEMFFVRYGRWRCHQELVGARAGGGGPLRKVLLSTEHVPELLIKLFRERVANHSLMPSYDAAAVGAATVHMCQRAVGFGDNWAEQLRAELNAM